MSDLKNYNLIQGGFRKSWIHMVLVFLIFILGLGYFISALSPVSKISNLKRVEINKGDGFSQISRVLEGAGIIRSSSVFGLLSIISGEAHRLKPGIYFLDSSYSTPNILNNLVSGPVREREVVIPEGLTLLDIDKKLSDAGILSSKALANFDINLVKNSYEFLKDTKSLEGYLFPDTYKFYINSEPGAVIRKFLDNFNLRVWPLLQTDSQFKANDIVKIASLVEKEAYFDQDRPIIAGVIYKRLKIGMGLQIDATITYAKCQRAVLTCLNPAITKAETALISPYNTYLYAGLPPTPISNPGLASLSAALSPVQSEYLYYLSDPKTHKIIFSKTLEEHNENRARYLGI